jgi:hypothetical protein
VSPAAFASFPGGLALFASAVLIVGFLVAGAVTRIKKRRDRD